RIARFARRERADFGTRRPVIEASHAIRARRVLGEDLTTRGEEDAGPFYGLRSAGIEGPDEGARRRMLRDEAEIGAKDERRRVERRLRWIARDVVGRNLLDGQDVRAYFVFGKLELPFPILDAERPVSGDVRFPHLRRRDDPDLDLLDRVDPMLAPEVLFEVDAVSLELEPRNVSGLDAHGPGLIACDDSRGQHLEAMLSKPSEHLSRECGLRRLRIARDESLILRDRVLEPIELLVEDARDKEESGGGLRARVVLSGKRPERNERGRPRVASRGSVAGAVLEDIS